MASESSKSENRKAGFGKPAHNQEVKTVGQRHKYEYKVNPNAAGAKVVRMVGANKRVLELGSGPGSITRLLKDNQCRITALELDGDAIKIVSEFCEEVYPCDLNDPQWPEKLSVSNKFEVIVAGDVLEHLYDPWATLGKLEPLLAENGYIVLSLPHASHNAIVACLLAGDFDYQPWGLLDKTHIRFFGIHNIQRLFNDAGFKIVEADFVVKAPEQTEFAGKWRQLSPATKQVLASSKFGTIYQVVVKAVPHSAHGKSLQLASLPVPAPTDESFSTGARGNRLLGFILSFISLRTRKKIAAILERIGFRI